MYYDANDIAKYVITTCTRKNDPISDLQLQKILYYIQLNFVKYLGYRAFNNEIQAWAFGPVVPDVYENYKMYGSAAIRQIFCGTEYLFTDKERVIADRVINACTLLTPWELVDKSHCKGGPWDRVYKDGYKEIIPMEIIEDYAYRRTY